MGYWDTEIFSDQLNRPSVDFLESCAIQYWTNPESRSIITNYREKLIKVIDEEADSISPLVMMLMHTLGHPGLVVRYEIPQAIRGALSGVRVSMVADILLIDVASYAERISYNMETSDSGDSPFMVPFDPIKTGDYMAIYTVDPNRDMYFESSTSLNAIGRMRKNFISEYFIHTKPIMIDELNPQSLAQAIAS